MAEGADNVWFLNAEDPAEGYIELSELLDGAGKDLVEVQHATVIHITWHVRLWDEENGEEWHRFDNKPDAEAFRDAYLARIKGATP